MAAQGDDKTVGAERFLIVEQIASPNRRPAVQQRTLIGLGLNKIGRRRKVKDTAEVRGMIRSIGHLVRIVDETTE